MVLKLRCGSKVFTVEHDDSSDWHGEVRLDEHLETCGPDCESVKPDKHVMVHRFRRVELAGEPRFLPCQRHGAQP